MTYENVRASCMTRLLGGCCGAAAHTLRMKIDILCLALQLIALKVEYIRVILKLVALEVDSVTLRKIPLTLKPYVKLDLSCVR